MWMVEKYLRWGLLFVFLWVVLWLWSSFGCSSVNSNQMEPYLVRDSFTIVRNGRVYPDQVEIQTSVLQFESTFVKERFNKYVARVIGKPGDRIRIEKGRVYRVERGSTKEEPLAEQYLKTELMSPPTEQFEDIIVPRDCYWLMGDNRKKEPDKDSRKFGPVQVHAVDGTVGKMPFTK